jgi:diaminohydroxyphosphoribosylaminopyrimidine deaminase/5-amino-6-(5-phosphoribosylamino)uracil reductase
VLTEAGAEVNGAVLRSGVATKAWIFVAPKILGRGVPFARIGEREVTRPPLLRDVALHRFGPDTAVEGYFRDVYGNR